VPILWYGLDYTKAAAQKFQEDQIYVLRLGVLPWAISYIPSELVFLSDREVFEQFWTPETAREQL